MDTQPPKPASTEPRVQTAEVKRRLLTAQPSLFGYITTIISGGIALGLLTAAGYIMLHYWLGDEPTGFFDSYLYDAYVYLEISLLAFAGLHVWTYLRNRTAINDETITGHGAARVFQAIFVAILAIVIVSNSVSLLFIAKTALLGTADYSAKGLWEALLGPLQAIVWASLVCWQFRRTVRSSKPYVLAAFGVAIVAAGLLLAFPIMSKRDATIDNRTANDLSAISSSISNYVTKRSSLPDQLDQLKIDDKVASRLHDYQYEKASSLQMPNVGISLEESRSIFPSPYGGLSYKLCATFKTDTTKDQSGGIIPLLSTYSGDFSRHKTGKQCFSKSTYSGVGYDVGDDGAGSSASSTSPALPTL